MRFSQLFGHIDIRNKQYFFYMRKAFLFDSYLKFIARRLNKQLKWLGLGLGLGLTLTLIYCKKTEQTIKMVRVRVNPNPNLLQED